MQDVMNIYEDYAAWKKENTQLISTLVKKRSDTIKRFSPVLAVVDYLYEKQLKRKLSEDEEVIFSTGFDYIHDAFLTIQNILESDFDNSIDKMEKCAKTINLLLYTIDFESELYSSDSLKNEIQKLYDFDQKLNDYLEKKQNAPDEYFALLDDITLDIFSKNNIEIQTVPEIFYEIALEYNIFHEDDFDVYNEVLNRQLEKERNIEKFVA